MSAGGSMTVAMMRASCTPLAHRSDGELVMGGLVTPECSLGITGQRSHVGDGHAERAIRADPETGHARDVVEVRA